MAGGVRGKVRKAAIGQSPAVADHRLAPAVHPDDLVDHGVEIGPALAEARELAVAVVPLEPQRAAGALRRPEFAAGFGLTHLLLFSLCSRDRVLLPRIGESP